MSGVIGIVVALIVGYVLFKLALKLIGVAIAVALGIGAYVLARRYLEKKS
ncbi:hypothetical protein [Sphingosinicella sp.]